MTAMTAPTGASASSDTAMPARILAIVSLALWALLLCGCGSKISEANYYRVQYGMTEDDVEDLLGPAHERSTVAVAATAPGVTTRPVERVQKSWTM